ncbi:MAG: hypothetical protein HZC55_26355 [Verrucomicrobia bacterium]|nr:hypothetical protein [Verrucomicrobiota bacterium]
MNAALFRTWLAWLFLAASLGAAETALQRFYAWPPPPDHPQTNGADFWDWRPELPVEGAPAPLVDLRSLNEAVAGQHGWVTRRGDKLVLGDGRPVRFWAVNTTGNAPLPELERLCRDLAQRGVNLVRIHGGARKSLLDFRSDRLDAVNPAVIDQMHRAVVAARAAGIYTFVSNSFFIIEMKVKASYGLEGYTQSWLDAHPGQQVPFGLVFLNDRFRAAFKGWLREFVTAPNPYHPQRTPLGRDRSVAVIEILNEDNLFFYTFKPETWPEEQRTLAGRKFFAWLAARHRAREDADATATVRRVTATWEPPLPGDDLSSGVLQLLNAGAMGTAGPRQARRLAEQIAFLGDVQRGFHAEMTALFRECGFGGLVSPSNWHTATPTILLDLEHDTYRQGDIIDRHAYFSPVIAQEKVKHRIGVGDVFLGLSTLVGPASSPTNVRQTFDYPSAMSEFQWVNYNAAGVEGPLLAAAYFSLTDFDLPVWFALGTRLWNDSLAKWAVGRPSVLGQFPGAALLFRRGDVAEAPVVVREGRTLEAIYRREPARIMPPRGFDSTRDDASTRDAPGSPGSERIDPLAMMVGKVEHTLDRDTDEVSPRLAELIDRRNGRVTSFTGELVTDWHRGLFTVNSPRAQGATGFLRAAGRIELRDVTWESDNRFGALLAIALDDRPLAASGRILLQVGAMDRPTGFVTEPVKLGWQGADYTGHRIKATGGLPWQVERSLGSVVLKGATARFTSATVLDENLRPRAPLVGRVEGSDLRLKLPAESLYVVVELRPAKEQ